MMTVLMITAAIFFVSAVLLTLSILSSALIFAILITESMLESADGEDETDNGDGTGGLVSFGYHKVFEGDGTSGPGEDFGCRLTGGDPMPSLMTKAAEEKARATENVSDEKAAAAALSVVALSSFYVD